MINIEQMNEEIDELRNIKIKIKELRKIYEILDNNLLKQELKEIIIISENIYKEVTLNIEKMTKIKNFSEYYITTLQKILDKYCYFKEKKIAGYESEKLYSKVEEFVPKVKISFEKMYQTLFNDDIIDLTVEIKVMLKELDIK